EIEEPPLTQVVRLPASALGSAGDVLILGEDNRLQPVPVTLMRRQGNDILVRSEALDNVQVLTDRTPLLGAGVKVVPFEDTPGFDDAPETALLEITEDQRERLMAFVRSGLDVSEEIKARLLGQLQEAQVPAELVERLERRIDG
ncbi:MAG: efflux transporter periplasmic adaptor subunit, partial [Pseudomonadota bacterium]